MTAGQRNCYEAIGQLLHAWDLDNVLFALDAHLGEMPARTPETKKKLRAFVEHVNNMRAALRINRAPIEETP